MPPMAPAPWSWWYREHGYAVNPLTAHSTFVPERASAAEAFQIMSLQWTAERRPVTHGADGHSSP